MSSEHSQFFLVRLWSDPASDGKVEWHGRLQHVLSGKAHSFGNLAMLLDLLIAVLPAASPDAEALPGHDEERAPPGGTENSDLECSQ